jgi:4-carboxymuconolactone decarboxylase
MVLLPQAAFRKIPQIHGRCFFQWSGSMATKKRGNPTQRSAPELPGPYQQFIQDYPELGAQHDRIGQIVDQVAGLDAKTCSLIKVGICVGAGLESALRSHVRRAVTRGASQAEVMQAILLGMNTVGFPRTVAAWTWAKKQFERGV